MEIQGYDISMIRGDTETIKVSCKDAQGADVPLEDGDTLYFTVKSSNQHRGKKNTKDYNGVPRWSCIYKHFTC